MTTRDELYKAFGPIMVEAVIRLSINEINILRQHAGLAERTPEQMVNALQDQIESLTKYEWLT